MRAPVVFICLAAACSAPQVPDAGLPDAGLPDAGLPDAGRVAGELDCPGYCSRTGTGSCSHYHLDSPCMNHCRCRFGETYDCMTVCPPTRACEELGFCLYSAQKTSCGTDDAGCARECYCDGYYVSRLSRCVTRCGGATFGCPAQASDPVSDAGCREAVTCSYAMGSCRCEPDAGWTCTL